MVCEVAGRVITLVTLGRHPSEDCSIPSKRGRNVSNKRSQSRASWTLHGNNQGTSSIVTSLHLRP